VTGQGRAYFLNGCSQSDQSGKARRSVTRRMSRILELPVRRRRHSICVIRVDGLVESKRDEEEAVFDGPPGASGSVQMRIW